MRPSTRFAGELAVAVAAVLSGPAWAAQTSQAGAIQAHGTRPGTLARLVRRLHGGGAGRDGPADLTGFTLAEVSWVQRPGATRPHRGGLLAAAAECGGGTAGILRSFSRHVAAICHWPGRPSARAAPGPRVRCRGGELAKDISHRR
jgi:hypothetical protein